MPISVIPKFLQKAFAATGAKTDIPLNADLINGRAGYNEGFPPINMTAVAAGGIPPYGQDMNGVLYDLSTAIQYIQSGIDFPFDSAFATAIGGYAVGAIVSDASDKSLLWVNGTASNTTFPTGWTSFKYSDPTETVRGLPLVATAAEAQVLTSNVKMLTPKTLADAFKGANQNLSSNGWQKLPGGMIIQWGSSTFSGTSLTITLPVAFVSGLFSCVATDAESDPAAIKKISVNTSSTTTITFACDSNAGVFLWIAIGK